MRHREVINRQTYRLVEPPALAQVELGAEAARLSAPAASDVPIAAGLFMVGSYAAIMGAFAVTIHGAHADFAILIGAFYLVMFFAVPTVMLRIESRDDRRPSLGEFVDNGMATAGGHISGAGALTQMLIVPVLLVFAILAMGITYLLV